VPVVASTVSEGMEGDFRKRGCAFGIQND